MTRVFFSGPAITRMIPSSSSTCVISRLPLRAVEQGGLVDQVGQVGAGEARGLAGERVDVDLLGQRLAAGVDLEDLRAALAVGAVDDDLAVEAARAQQRRVEDVGPVGGGDEMMLSFISKPSISTSSWLSVCSRSSCPPPRPAPRWRPTASISSMKMMQGEFCLACSKRSRTREAPTPTNISTKSEPEIEKNGTPASPATARASSVLPVPGGP